MKKKLAITCAAIMLSGCISPYEYKDCGVLYDKPTANMHGTGGNLLPDTWGDVIVASRSANQDHFFKNNARMLTGKKAQAPNLKKNRSPELSQYELSGKFLPQKNLQYDGSDYQSRDVA